MLTMATKEPLTDEVDTFLDQVEVKYHLARFPGGVWNPSYERWSARFGYQDKAGKKHQIHIHRWVRVSPRRDLGKSAYEILSARVRSSPDDFPSFCSTYGYDPESDVAKAEFGAQRQEATKVQQFFARVAADHPDIPVLATLERI
jgi:hypothetical protein